MPCTILKSAICCSRDTQYCDKVIDYFDFNRAASDAHILI